ncbi:MAG: transposase [Planctomycetes bacterium]|nr:transposase [Planctomycetota bacterium]
MWTGRGHWGIENKLHWVLDDCLNEDQCRVRKGNGPQNFATLRHIALNLIRKNKSKGISIKGSRKKAGWDESYLLQLLRN